MCFIEDQVSATDDFTETYTAADRRRPLRRELVDRVLRLAEALPTKDRELLIATYQDGRTAVELGALLGEQPRSIRRQISRLTSRVLSPQFRFVIAHRANWPPLRRRIATEIFIHGRSVRAAAIHLRLSLHTVRRHCMAVLAMLEAAMASREIRP